MNIAAFLLALMKALPAAQKIFSDVQDLYYKQQEAADLNRYARHKAARDAIIRDMERPEVTDAELKDLRHSLYHLRRK